MNRNMVVAEWIRARESLRAAQTLPRNGLYADAISRAYYAILHAAKAGLHVHDVAAESHSAVRRMFGQTRENRTRVVGLSHSESGRSLRGRLRR